MATARQQQRLASCHSMGTSCQLTSLPCGMRLNVTVQADGTTCNSSSQPKAVVETAPCIPTNVAATLNCTSNIASITWHSALGATWYLVKAVSSQGYKTSCNNTVTNCDIPNLQCGQEYSITVTGMNGVCMGPASQPVTLVSAPCHNTGIQASLACRTNSALISWTPGNGTLSFNATLQSFQDPQKHSCFTNGSSCNIGSLPCGQHYNISVTGYGQTCSTCSKTLVTLDTAPCPPQNVSAIVQCDLGSVLVSWNPAVDASQFRVELESESTSAISSCNSTNTQCSIAHLPCGERFNLSVVALRGSCQSQPSSDLSISSAPCIPQGVNGTVDCVTNSAWVSWDVDNGAESYTVLAVRDDGQNSTCSSSNSTCNVPDLGCGRSYTFVVTASNAACLSPPSNSFQLETAPCALSSIMVVAECHSSVIMVQWQRARSGKSLYIATAEDQDRSLLSCNSSTSSCNLTNVQCDKEYIIIVAASTNQCSSLRSPPYKIRTGTTINIMSYPSNKT
uniref:Fibronectin type-III domain-containing protein n=1 Tax=Cyprinus carpio TaxID=7962 RepID=A0A8C1YC66_CYPCA